MKRGQPLKRTGWMRGPRKAMKRRSRTNSENRWTSKTYRDAGKDLPCAFCGKSGTTVGAHVRLAGFCGTGLKPPDWLLVDACFDCHTQYGDMNKGDFAEDVLRALAVTLSRRAEKGFLRKEKSHE